MRNADVICTDILPREAIEVKKPKVSLLVSKMTKKAKLEVHQDIMNLLNEKQIEIDKNVKDYGKGHELTKKVMNEWFGMLEMAQKLTGLMP